MRGRQNDHDQLGRDLWDALDLWEPEPISQDFKRRLYSRVNSLERRMRRARIIVPAIGFLIIATFFTATQQPDSPDLRNTNASHQENAFEGKFAANSQTKEMVRTLSDLGMLQSLSRTKSL